MNAPSVREPGVCLVIGSFYPRVGGGETHARLLARELRSLGTPVRVLTRRYDPALPRHESVDGVPVERVGPSGFPRFGKYLMLPGTLLALIRARREFDVIYVCGLRVLGLAGVAARLLLRKRVILRAEACGEWSGAFVNAGRADKPIPALVRWAIRLRNRFFLKADCFLAISRAVREEFLAGGIPGPAIALIPNGIDFSPFDPPSPEERLALRRQFGFEGLFVFAYSGKLNRGKGLEMLLRVFARVAAENSRAHLALIGGGGTQFLSCEAELKAFVRERGLSGRVTFTGYTDRVNEYLKAADAFVFPSESESLGLALIEAMACGLPSLASATGGILDIITDGVDGRLLPVGNDDAWYSAMDDVMKNPQNASRWGQAARDSVRRRFSIHEAALRHQALFRELMRR